MILRLFFSELRLLARNKAQVLNPLAFLFLGVMLFSVGVPSAVQGNGIYAGAVLWFIVLLTNLLALDGLFRRDYDNGVLEQILCASEVPFMVILMRIFVHWLHTGLLITLLAPLLSLALGIELHALPVVMLALLLGTPALSFIGATGAALTVGFSRGGVLLALLVLPLFLPVLIFGAHVVNDAVAGNGNSAQLYWLAFISMVAFTIGPFATTVGLKISVQLQ